MATVDIYIDHVLHDYPAHTSRKIVPGTVAPYIGQELVMMGAAAGEGRVAVSDVGQRELIAGRLFLDLVKLDCSGRRTQDGDSGAACYEVDEDGNYRMVCICFAERRNGRVGWAFPASSAETLKGIRFGNTPPTVRAGSP